MRSTRQATRDGGSRTALGLALGAALAIGLIGPAAAQDAPSPNETSDGTMFWFPGTPLEGQPVPGSTTSYMAYEDGVSATIATSGLEPGHAVTTWWVVFNEPELCTNGEGGLRCGEHDLLIFGGDPAIEGSVLYGGGHVIAADGSATFGGYLMPGDASGIVVDGPGLTDPLAADVHLVLRDHGPIQPGLFEAALATFGGGCTEAPEGTGPLGSFACYDVQFAAHEPTLGS